MHNRKKSYIWMMLLAALFSGLHGFGQGRDTIVLYNGQILIGEVQSANFGAISIDDIDMKMQSVKLYKIRKLTIKHRFKIETVDKHIFYGYFKTSEQDGSIILVPDGMHEISMLITNISDLISLERLFFKRVHGNLSAGFSFTKSSGIGQVNLSSAVEFATRHFDNQLSASELASIDSSRFSRDNENVQLFTAYELSPTWIAAAVLQYQRNIELSISRRFLEMLGVGNKLIITNYLQLMALTGLTLTQELSTDNVNSAVQLEIPVMLRFNFFKFRHPNIQINSVQSLYFSLSQQGRIRYDGSTSFSWELVRYFYLNINPYTNYDSHPPANASSTFDYGIVVGISYRF